MGTSLIYRQFHGKLKSKIRQNLSFFTAEFLLVVREIFRFYNCSRNFFLLFAEMVNVGIGSIFLRACSSEKDHFEMV